MAATQTSLAIASRHRRSGTASSIIGSVRDIHLRACDDGATAVVRYATISPALVLLNYNHCEAVLACRICDVLGRRAGTPFDLSIGVSGRPHTITLCQLITALECDGPQSLELRNSVVNVYFHHRQRAPSTPPSQTPPAAEPVAGMPSLVSALPVSAATSLNVAASPSPSAAAITSSSTPARTPPSAVVVTTPPASPPTHHYIHIEISSTGSPHTSTIVLVLPPLPCLVDPLLDELEEVLFVKFPEGVCRYEWDGSPGDSRWGEAATERGGLEEETTGIAEHITEGRGRMITQDELDRFGRVYWRLHCVLR
ncbi:hypothetical protein DFH27DRAFT_581681 [Peziza echinospora]|nr:hypothetical protein DFH27DRAFT_581681 [Peziza echinospora]